MPSLSRLTPACALVATLGLAGASHAEARWGPVKLGMNSSAAWKVLERAGVGKMPRVDITKAMKKAPRGGRLWPFAAKKLTCRRAVRRAYFRRRPGDVGPRHSSTAIILCASSVGHWRLTFSGKGDALSSISFFSPLLTRPRDVRALIQPLRRALGKPHEIKRMTSTKILVWRRAGARFWLSRYRQPDRRVSVSLSVTPLPAARK